MIPTPGTFSNPNPNDNIPRINIEITTPKIDPETIRNGVGNWVFFFVGLERWKMEAWGVAGGGQEFEKRGPA